MLLLTQQQVANAGQDCHHAPERAGRQVCLVFDFFVQNKHAVIRDWAARNRSQQRCAVHAEGISF
jgi:hypothetical protein